MQIQTALALMPLCPRQPQRLRGAQGARLRGVRGTTWVTIDHDRRDVLLEPGDVFVLDSAQGVMLSALGGEALLEVRDPPTAAAGA